MVRPCGSRELNARIRRVLFRYRAIERREGNVYDDGLLRLDSAQQRAWTARSPLPLSRTEFRVLDRLARHAGAVQHFGTLLEAGWGTPDPGSRDRIKFTVSRLRGKLDATPVGGGPSSRSVGWATSTAPPAHPSCRPPPDPCPYQLGTATHMLCATRATLPRHHRAVGEAADFDMFRRGRRRTCGSGRVRTPVWNGPGRNGCGVPGGWRRKG
ncbi:hypothetical protein DDE05_60385 [Streptomyces cavourensis]|nr:hypothetical protein DDE05_60385 [Streptomyces cavourensis]